MGTTPILNEAYWNQRYEQKQTGWDIGYASAPLVHFAESIENKALKVLIPGCGNAYEAVRLFELGFKDITLLDIAPVLTKVLEEHFADLPIKIITADFFIHQGQYELILEQTFFCALDPSLRKAYAAKMHELLRPGGMLAGVLFDRDFEGGPPFGGSKAEYRLLLEPHFEIRKMEACYNSIRPRAGTELFFIVVPKASPPAHLF